MKQHNDGFLLRFEFRRSWWKKLFCSLLLHNTLISFMILFSSVFTHWLKDCEQKQATNQTEMNERICRSSGRQKVEWRRIMGAASQIHCHDRLPSSLLFDRDQIKAVRTSSEHL